MSSWLQLYRRRRGDNRSGDFDDASGELYDLLLAPFRGAVSRALTVVFVPDRVLFSIPFGALRDRETFRYLVQDKVITVAPSLNAVGSLLKHDYRPSSFRDASVLAVANPTFDRDAFPGLANLFYAEKESEQIERWFPARTILRGRDATKIRFLDEWERHEIVHFAGHALIDEERPLESALVLSPSAGESSGGVLRAHELLRKNPGKTGVVVLSACDTARPGASVSEGIAGIMLPFISAGVRSTIASLWAVDDRATANLFTVFYEALAEGMSPAAALRAAKLRIIGDRANEGWSWAAFEVFGIER